MRPPTPELVHSRLDRWAQDRGQALAVRSEAGSITFASLAQQVQAHAQALDESRAPATVLQDAALSLPQRLVAFLGTIASGRCAAVSDPAWPPAVLAAVRASLPSGVYVGQHRLAQGF
jgi:long-chain acyl-CoA synthetase